MRKDSGVYPGDGVVGRERSAWYLIGKLRVSSGFIEARDLGCISGPDGVGAMVPQGGYLAEARIIDFGGSLCVSRVRVRLETSAAVLGGEIGKISVDLAAVALADFRTISQKLSSEEFEELNDCASDCRRGVANVCKVKFEKLTAQFVACMSGFGDGTFPVFLLKSRGRRIGLEIEFIRDGHVLNEGFGPPQREESESKRSGQKLRLPPADEARHNQLKVLAVKGTMTDHDQRLLEEYTRMEGWIEMMNVRAAGKAKRSEKTLRRRSR
jgi:hypothetical protein